MSNISLSKLLQNNADYHHSLMEENMIMEIREWVTENLHDVSDDAIATLLRDVFESNKHYLTVDYGCDMIVDHIVNEVLNHELYE